MTDEARAAKNAYQREWKRKNIEKARAAAERYWEKKANELKQERQQGGT